MAITYLQAHEAIMSKLPTPTGWLKFDAGQATPNNDQKPPWVIWSLKPRSRPSMEAVGSTAARTAVLEARIVAPLELSVNVMAEKLRDTLDGLIISPQVDMLTPRTDSGSYPSDLINPDTTVAYQMRVLTWQTGWNS